MRILIACDSFKDALPAQDVCQAIAKGLRRRHPSRLELEEMPLSDGGEGVLEILRRKLSLTPVNVEVADPLFRPVVASYGISADGTTALVEMAQASGLERLTIEERNPLLTSTFGTGQVLVHAKAQGVRRALLALGGSATNDAGVGAAAALGWRFLNASGEPVQPIGKHLLDIVQAIPPPQPIFDEVRVLCDVTNPLFGQTGAALTFGRQKGGSDEMLFELDTGLRQIAALIEKQLRRPGLAEVPGAGAAGGFGFGAMAFLNAKLERGIEMVLDLLKFEEAARNADFIITGEGRIDKQSGQGKLIQGVCSRAGTVPVVALCGDLAITFEEARAMGLRAAYSINPFVQPLPELLAATADNLEKAAADLTLPDARSTEDALGKYRFS
ncbi:MAG: glycerate kinase [Alphaproteobacteria bacterium]|nr:glycerate kinase [Alphaproteobacteria bacterium]